MNVHLLVCLVALNAASFATGNKHNTASSKLIIGTSLSDVSAATITASTTYPTVSGIQVTNLYQLTPMVYALTHKLLSSLSLLQRLSLLPAFLLLPVAQLL